MMEYKTSEPSNFKYELGRMPPKLSSVDENVTLEFLNTDRPLGPPENFLDISIFILAATDLLPLINDI
jgi:hypothetical protein